MSTFTGDSTSQSTIVSFRLQVPAALPPIVLSRSLPGLNGSIGEKPSSHASYVDGTLAFLIGGPLLLLKVIKDSKSGCITGVRAIHIGKTTTQMGLAWPQQPGPAETTSSVLQLAGNEIIQKAEVWLNRDLSASQHSYALGSTCVALVRHCSLRIVRYRTDSSASWLCRHIAPMISLSQHFCHLDPYHWPIPVVLLVR